MTTDPKPKRKHCAACVMEGYMARNAGDMRVPVPKQAAIADNTNQPALHVLHRDYETRGVLSLKAVGTYRYAADPRTEVLCCAYAQDDNPVQVWVPGDPVPPEFIEAAQNPAWPIAAHGDHFETQTERRIMVPRFGWPEIPVDWHRCTMTAALAAGLPARLSADADALELVNRKDSAGERLMHQTSKPRPARKDERADCTEFPDWLLEECVDHLVGSPIRRSYRRGAQDFSKRRKAFDAGGDYLAGGSVIPLRAVAS